MDKNKFAPAPQKPQNPYKEQEGRVRLSPADLIRQNEILKFEKQQLLKINERLMTNITEFILKKPLDIILVDKEKGEMTVKCCFCGAESTRRF